MINDQTQEINFVISGIKGDIHTFALMPMKTKIAHNVLHNVLLTVLETVASALREDISDDEATTEIVKGLKTLDFDSFWFIAERVLAYSRVDGGTDVKRLEDATWHRQDPTLLYRAVFEGIKGNYPDVFMLLDLEGLFRKKEEKDPNPAKQEQTTDGDTQEQKLNTVSPKRK